MTASQPQTIRTQDYVGGFGDGDHSDHHATAYLARQAHAAYATSHVLVAYQDYSTRSRPANVAGADLTAKSAAWTAYLQHDAMPCGSPPSCGSNEYAAWLQRQYTLASEPGGNTPPANTPPVASAGAAQSVAARAAVTLDGSGSRDADGDPLTYRWTQTSGTAVTLSSATAQRPTFTAPAAAATLVFSLVVSDGKVDSAPASVTVSVAAPAPTNLALGRPARASSVETAGFEAGKASDGSLSTRWSSSYANNQWWRVDLGAATTVASVVVSWERSARYVRILCVTRATGWGSSFWEAAVYGA
jgi:hypothetical protein